MVRMIQALAWTAAVTLVTALPNEALARQSDLVTEGARVYGNMCGRCHNPRSPLERTDRSWVAIANHMRVRGNLTGRQVRNVLAFLQATNTDPRERQPLLPPPMVVPNEMGGGAMSDTTVSTDPRVVARGRELVEQRACLGCHVVGGRGGQVGPNLNGVVGRRGVDFVRNKLADPTVDNATSMMPNFGLTPQEIEALMAYLASLNGGGA